MRGDTGNGASSAVGQLMRAWRQPCPGTQHGGARMLEEVFSILASTPIKLHKEIDGLTARQMKRRPAPEKWSIQEILAHLDDVEEHAMRARVAAILNEDRPHLPVFDQEGRVEEMKYRRIDPRHSLRAFARKRRVNLKWLRRLRPAQLKRVGIHAAVGEISAGEFIHEWAFHDLGHLKQILEVKRYSLYPRMGAMRAFYKLS